MDELFADRALRCLIKNKNAPYTLATVSGLTCVQRLIQARKFVMDSGVVQSGGDVSLDALIKGNFEKLVTLCKSPFQRMWIEYETKDRTDEHDIIIGALIDAAPRSLHIEYIVEHASGTDKQKVIPLPVNFVVGVDEDRPIDIDSLGGKYRNVMAIDVDQKNRNFLLSRCFLQYSGSPAIEQDVISLCSKLLFATLGTLALVNVVPTEITPQPRKQGQRLIQGRLRPYFESSVVTIKLPARRVKGLFSKTLKDIGSKKRRHEVRGHYRHYLNKDGTLKRRTWIENHDRGDASLGWVRHASYSVEGPQHVALPKVAYQTPTED